MTVAAGAPVFNTCYEIITDAYRDCGLLGLGDNPNSEQTAEAMRRLNKYVNYLQTQGLKLFVQEDFALTLVQGQGLYTLGPTGNVAFNAKPRRCIEAYYTDNNQNRRPLILMSRNEWDTLSTTTTQGTVTSVFPDKQQLTLNINLWLVPDATAVTGQVHLILDEQIGNFAQVTDTMAFPPEWSLCLEWGLAYQLSTGQPEAVITQCKMNSEKYEFELTNWDVEDASTFFQPDTRGLFTGRRFG